MGKNNKLNKDERRAIHIQRYKNMEPKRRKLVNVLKTMMILLVNHKWVPHRRTDNSIAWTHSNFNESHDECGYDIIEAFDLDSDYLTRDQFDVSMEYAIEETHILDSLPKEELDQLEELEELEQVKDLKRHGGAFERFRNAEFEFLKAMAWVPMAASRVGPILWVPPGYITAGYTTKLWHHTESAIEIQMHYLRNAWYDTETIFCQENDIQVLGEAK